ncbi:TIPIN [Bugula neritina]|uniref:TIMELESS-interacting protein n=1 Tax=Bugula neritina TaxID=10212 RepID=A0A7J7K406_BUGNE|nr:TIPIN [Bugula neritina]
MDDLFDDGDVEQELENFEAVEEGADDNLNQESADIDGNSQDENEGDISQQVAERLKQLGKGAAKKRVLKPQPKLDPTRLTGERGIPILPKLFENVKYKGKGHEVEDLNKMMAKMEHWAHRLFPKLPFDQLIERVERLGQKKPVQSCVNKIRLDMPILDEDFVTQLSDGEDKANGDDTAHNSEDVTDFNIENEYERNILEEDEEALNDIIEQERREVSQHVLTASTPYPKSRSSAPDRESLTNEQKERIKQNQEKARQRRLDKSALDQTVNSDTTEQVVSAIDTSAHAPETMDVSEQFTSIDAELSNATDTTGYLHSVESNGEGIG